MFLYKTIQNNGIAETVIEKSRFIGYAKPVASREEADAFIAEIKKKHKDANHNVPAIVLGEKFQQQWASDDGEPQGTAGAPIVQMLVMEKITNVAVVVTRYFGGIKLGTGGLVRAYTNAAKAALEAAVICCVEEMSIMEIEMDYTFVNKLKNLEGVSGSADGVPWFKITHISYAEHVSVTILCHAERNNEVAELLMNLTGGSYALISAENTPVKLAVLER